MNDGRKKKPQKHQNKTAFKITFDTQALEKQKKVSLKDLCIRCTQIMQWKLQYNKYKKMTEPARCNICNQKHVYRTYMTACQPCVQAKNICAKCLTPNYEAPEEVRIPQKEKAQQQKKQYKNQIDFMKTLQERSRRAVRRGIEKGKITWDSQQGYFVDEQGKNMIGLHFKKGFTIDEDGNEPVQDEDIMDHIDDDDIFGDDDDQQHDQDQDEGLISSKKQNKNNGLLKEAQNKGKSSKKQINKPEAQISNKKQDNSQNQNQCQDQNQWNSDAQGDQVDCEHDLDFVDRDDDEELEQDLENMQLYDDNQQQEQQKPAQKKSKSNQDQKKNKGR